MSRSMADSKALRAPGKGSQSESKGWFGGLGSSEKPNEEQDVSVPLSTIPTHVSEACGTDLEANSNNNSRGAEKTKFSLRSVQQTTWKILAHSWINCLLVFVPAGVIVRFIPDIHGGVIFATNCVAIIPLAGLMAYATESAAQEVGDALGALMNVTLGNLVELIIFIALTKNKIRIVQASILGSILANVLLILGMAFFLGGMKYREQLYNNTVTQMSACLLSLSVISLVLPTAFHASFRNSAVADIESLKISRGTSVILLLVYIIFLVFQLKSHAYLYKSTPRHIVDAEAMPGPAAAWLEPGNSGGSSDSRYDSGGSNQSLDSVRARVGKSIRDMAAKRAGGRRKAAFARSDCLPGGEGGDNDVASSFGNPHSLSHMESMETCVDGGNPENMVERERRHSLGSHPNDKGKRRVAKIIDTVLMNEDGLVRDTHAHPGKDNEKAEQGAVGAHGKGQNVPSKSCEKQQESGHAGPSSPKSVLRNLRGSVSQITPVLFPPDPEDAEPNGVQEDSGKNTRAVALSRVPTGKSGHQPEASRVPKIRDIVFDGTVDDEEEDTVDGQRTAEPGDEYLTRTPAIILLVVSTGLVALCAEFLVGSIEEVTQSSPLGEIFIGLIVLPIVGNAAEHITSITVAIKNKMDLAIGVTVGSSIQIALCITPLVVILGWAMGKEMSLYFTLFETVCLFVSTFMANFLVLDGRSNYMEGALLCTVYVLIAVVAFFYPEAPAANAWGGGEGAMGGG